MSFNCFEPRHCYSCSICTTTYYDYLQTHNPPNNPQCTDAGPSCGLRHLGQTGLPALGLGGFGFGLSWPRGFRASCGRRSEEVPKPQASTQPQSRNVQSLRCQALNPTPYSPVPTFQILTTSLNLEDLNPSQLQVLRSISPKPESRKP